MKKFLLSNYIEQHINEYIDVEMAKQEEVFGCTFSETSREVLIEGNFRFIAIHYDINTSSILHRYLLLAFFNDSVIYESSNAVDMDKVFTAQDVKKSTLGYFEHVSKNLSKLSNL